MLGVSVGRISGVSTAQVTASTVANDVHCTLQDISIAPPGSGVSLEGGQWLYLFGLFEQMFRVKRAVYDMPIELGAELLRVRGEPGPRDEHAAGDRGQCLGRVQRNVAVGRPLECRAGAVRSAEGRLAAALGVVRRGRRVQGAGLRRGGSTCRVSDQHVRTTGPARGVGSRASARG